MKFLIKYFIYLFLFLFSFIYFTYLNININSLYKISKYELSNHFGITLKEKMNKDKSIFINIKAKLDSISLAELNNLIINKNYNGCNITIKKIKLLNEDYNFKYNNININYSFFNPTLLFGYININDMKSKIKINLLNNKIILRINKKNYISKINGFKFKNGEFIYEIKY